MAAIIALLAPALVGAALPSATNGAPGFGLPLAGQPDPSNWYVAQWYGRTVWAYRNWEDLYSRGQGLHFGIDFATRCGTAALSIGDGVVFAVDGPYGSAPHNVVIDHRDGYLSLYGHLQERSNLRVGQAIAKGDVVGLTGDPATAQCDQAAHLHLEIRRTGMGVAVDPVALIQADWRAMTIGADTLGQRFELDYAAPGDRLTLDDQPDVRFGGPLLTQNLTVWPPR